MNLNEAKLIGRAVRDPEVKTTQTGSKVAKFSVATNHVYKDSSGSKKETTQFHTCIAWGKLADTIGKYMVKGQEVYVSGRIEYRQWETKEGQKRFSTEIIVEDFQFQITIQSDGSLYAWVKPKDRGFFSNFNTTKFLKMAVEYAEGNVLFVDPESGEKSSKWHYGSPNKWCNKCKCLALKQ